jgi:hypothetical protein
VEKPLLAILRRDQSLCLLQAHPCGLALRATGAVVGIVGLAMPQSGGDGDARIAAPGCNMSVGEDHVLARPAGTCHAAKRTLIVINNRSVRVGVPSGGVFKLAAANQRTVSASYHQSIPRSAFPTHPWGSLRFRWEEPGLDVWGDCSLSP